MQQESWKKKRWSKLDIRADWVTTLCVRRGEYRLHVQHWMWNVRLGYLLHPGIRVPSAPAPAPAPAAAELDKGQAEGRSFKIADVGTGNAYVRGEWESKQTCPLESEAFWKILKMKNNKPCGRRTHAQIGQVS